MNHLQIAKKAAKSTIVKNCGCKCYVCYAVNCFQTSTAINPEKLQFLKSVYQCLCVSLPLFLFFCIYICYVFITIKDINSENFETWSHWGNLWIYVFKTGNFIKSVTAYSPIKVSTCNIAANYGHLISSILATKIVRVTLQTVEKQ